jgi:hypothetical protein
MDFTVIEELIFLPVLNCIRIIKSRRMRWAGYVAQMGRRRMHIGFWWEAGWKETTRKT